MKHPSNRAERLKLKSKKVNKYSSAKDREALIRLKLEQEALEQKEAFDELRKEVYSQGHATQEGEN